MKLEGELKESEAMSDAEDKWGKLRQIVREEIERAFSLHPQRKSTVGLKLTGSCWEGITEEQMAAWREAYPAVNIEQQLKLAAAWCVSNPQDSPKSQWARFLNGWLSRHQNQHSLRSIPINNRQPTTCANCADPLAGGFTRTSIGDVCGKCYRAYMNGAPWKKSA